MRRRALYRFAVGCWVMTLLALSALLAVHLAHRAGVGPFVPTPATTFWLETFPGSAALAVIR